MSSGPRLDWARNSLSIDWLESAVATGTPDAAGLVLAGGGCRWITGDANCSSRRGCIPPVNGSGFTLAGFPIGVKKFTSMLRPLRLTLEALLALAAAELVSKAGATCGHVRSNQVASKELRRVT
jgi:hypothetical protein